MADRKVKVSLLAQVAEYERNMRKAAQATRETADEADKLKDAQKVMDLLGKSAVVAGGLLATGLGVAVNKWAEFDEAMSAVQAATHESVENMQALSDASIQAGADSVFSATEAANAVEELAKAGVSTADILAGGLTGALDLAAAGGLGVADAAGIAATAMTQFGLAGDQTAHVADLLAAGAGKAMGDVTDLAGALNQSGLVANQFGLSIEETTGVLAAFAANGLIGSDAGTSFKSMLQRLVPVSEKSKKLMDELGLSAFDASGQFIGMSEYAGELQKALGDMTVEQRQSAMAVLFGSDAVRAASVLYEQGAEGIGDWISQVDDAGYASETAALRLDNLRGDLEALGGAIDSAAISAGEAADGPLRALVQAGTGLVDMFNDLPDGAKQAAFFVAAVGAAGLLAGGSFLLAVPKIAAYNAALATMGTTAQRTGRALALVGKAAGALAVVGLSVAAVNSVLEEIRNRLAPTTSELANALHTATTAKDLFDRTITRENIRVEGQIEPIIASVKELRDVLRTASHEGDNLWDWLNANTAFTAEGAQFNEFRERWQALAKEMASAPDTIGPAFRKIRDEFELTDEELSRLIELSPELKDALNEQATAAGDTATAQARLHHALREAEEPTEANEAALRELAGQAEETGDAVEDLADQIRGFGSATLSTREANRQFEAAIDDLTESIEANGKTLDVTEAAGRANQAAIDDVAKSTYELAAATYEQTGSQEDANAVLARGREELINLLGRFGVTGQAAKDYADKLGLIPENINTAVAVNTGDAAKKITDFITTYNGKQITLKLKASDVVVNGRVFGGLRSDYPGNADGGAIYGPGTGTSDTAGLFRLSNGEHVWTAAEVAAVGGQGAMYAMRAAVREGTWRGYAGGGSVSTTAPAAQALPAININGPITVANVDEMARALETQRRRAYARAGVR